MRNKSASGWNITFWGVLKFAVEAPIIITLQSGNNRLLPLISHYNSSLLSSEWKTPEPKQLPERRFERNTKNINLNFAKLGIESEELLSNSIAYIDSEAFRFFLTTERSCCIFSALHMPFLALPRNETPSISIGTMNGPRFVNQHRIMSLDWESLLSITYQLLAAVPYESQALARLKKVNSSEMEEGKRGELNRSHSTARGFTFYSI